MLAPSCIINFVAGAHSQAYDTCIYFALLAGFVEKPELMADQELSRKKLSVSMIDRVHV